MSLDRNFPKARETDETRSKTIENHGFDSGKILYRYEDELDTNVAIDVTFWIAGADRKKFLKAFVDLTDEFRI